MKISNRWKCAFFLISVIFTSCGTMKPYYGKNYRDWQTLNIPDTANLKYSVFLIGDAGTLDNNPILDLMNQQMRHADSITSKGDASGASQNSVVFLGDNIYYYGLPDEDAFDREEKETIINNQMDALQGFRGRKFFIPGNHDWKASSPGGLEALNREEQYIETYADSTIEFLPNRGCPGPLEVHMADDLVIIMIDSEWWLTRHEKPMGPENGCFVDDRFDFIVQLEDAIERNAEKNILIVQHHPLFSNSNHGGRYSLKDNIFPLTLVRDNLYIPLPVIGSLYPLLRKYGVSRQDISNPVYQKLIEEMLSVIEDQPNVIVAAGHDHNLQLRDFGEISHIVSGSGGKVNYAARGAKASYVHQIMGFSRLNYYDNGEVWVEFWTADEDTPEGTMTFRYPLYALKPPAEETLEEQENISYEDSTKVVVAGKEYEGGNFKQFWLGSHYREEWITPVQVDYLDMKTEAGGLTPIQKGGENQTISLRLLDRDSTQYNLRSINKTPSVAIPELLFDALADDLVQDQISTAHPYGAFAIPRMAEKLRLFHSKPKLFYVPHTNLLTHYLDDFGGRLAMLEVEPEENLSDLKQYGDFENVVSTKTMFRQLEEDHANKIDEEMFLKSRLFDMLINDWDRHEDQWRWAKFEEKDESVIFRPVARDRDQVFTKYDGVIPYLMSRKWGLRNFQHFDHQIHDIKGLNLAARHLDRNLLTSLSREDWLRIASQIQSALTDDVIRKAIADMPQEVVKISGKEIIDKLKSRKENISTWALRYYSILAEEVDVTGSNKSEFFDIEIVNDREINVGIFKEPTTGRTQEKIFERTFYAEETREIRIYARGGEDSVLVRGSAPNKIKIRIVGGSGDDVITDAYQKGKIFVYDQTTEDNVIQVGSNARVKTSPREIVNDYNRQDFKYDYFGPRLFIEYNRDEGVYVGGGIYVSKNGFRKYPKTTHKLLAHYAANVEAFNIKYEGNFYSLLGRHWDLSIQAHSFGPNYVINYFGHGNDSPGELEDIDYYRIRLNSLKFQPSVNYRFTEHFKVGFGPVYEYFDLKENPGTIIDNIKMSGESSAATSTHFTGGKLFANFVFQDHEKDPTRGVKWLNEANYYRELKGNIAFTNYSTDVSVYITPTIPINLTAAIRFGASTNVGDYQFYQSEFLGGNSNLRGFRNFRFAGRSAMFNNTEVRIRLFDIRNYVFTGNYGIIGFVDSGRVWSDRGDESKKWHRAYGPGIWVNFYKLFLVSATVGFSEEGDFFNLRLGHFF